MGSQGLYIFFVLLINIDWHVLVRLKSLNGSASRVLCVPLFIVLAKSELRKIFHIIMRNKHFDMKYCSILRRQVIVGAQAIL